MIKLNLEAKNNSQQRILEYLQENASETLAEKINNGTPFEKGNKQLVGIKTLDGFMKFACDEARKQAEKGANSACVEDCIVFGWAIHYFEEDSIEGTLYNLDGTEYKPVVKAKTNKTTASIKTTTKAKQNDNGIKQTSFFDLFDEQPDEQENAENVSKIGANTENNVEKDIFKQDYIEVEEPDNLDDFMEDDETEEQEELQHPLSPLYARYIEIGERYLNNVIIQKLGDFYEIFDEYAVEISDKLDLTLTSRDFGFKSRTPMIGFPYHAADNYINKIRQYYNVTIIDGNDIKELPQIVMVDGTMIDKETGEILNEGVCEQQTSSLLDIELMQYLNTLLDNKIKFM
ncbi:MAG TPA: Cas9 inhibitor AcrIIA9 family protein [Candidatus Pelethenecus sp.]|nr:Cas9 inhibitor AcrIIA9 family protein [Candidatus Pelethenecus sp.]